MPEHLSSDQLYRLAAEETFSALKQMSKARAILKRARKTEAAEEKVLSDGPGADMKAAMAEYMAAAAGVGGDPLDRVLGSCIQAISQELLGFDGVEIAFGEAKIKLEKITFPVPVEFRSGRTGIVEMRGPEVYPSDGRPE